MKKKLYLATIAACAFICAAAQPVSYDAPSIPASLKEGAHVVKRFEEIIFHVKDIDKATHSVHQVFTVLDQEGKDALDFYVYTDKQRTIDEIDIRVYDAAGKQVVKYKKKDLNKQASQSGLIDDVMFHYLSIPATNFPMTVEYNYAINTTGTLHYPSYNIQDPKESLESSSFTAIVPNELDLRYMEQLIKLPPAISHEAKNKVYRWSAKNLSAYPEEEGSIDSRFYGPAIILAPNKFRHFNTIGEMNTWKAYGAWAFDLMKGLDELPEERKAFFVDLVKNATSEREKVALIYKYLQTNFRYVSIQLGIGGYKPFPAKFTDEKKYGDCKGLSFYMYSALKAVGINSHCALVIARYNGGRVAESFPCQRFNHMILCVPQVKDSIWLECTSNTSEFAILGSFTENRNALLLTENGGVLVSTPDSKASNNMMSSITNISLKEDGSGTTVTSISSKGDYKEYMTTMVTAKKDDQKKMIVRYLGFKQPDEFSVVKKTHEGSLDVDIALSIEKIPQFSAGSKMFLNPRVYRLWNEVLPKSEGRKQDYYFHSPFIRTDTTVYSLPEGYVAESVPTPVSLKCEYGTYTTHYSYLQDKNQVMSVARLELLRNGIPSAKYAEVKKFFDGVIAEDAQKIVIKKN